MDDSDLASVVSLCSPFSLHLAIRKTDSPGHLFSSAQATPRPDQPREHLLYERLPPSPPLDPGIEDRPNVPHCQLYYQLGRGCKAHHPVEVVVQRDGPDDRGDPAVHVSADVEDDRAAVCGTESAWWLRSTGCATIIMPSHYPHIPFRLSLT